ncbi:multiple epidermal growth factor-like domains protein 6 isoform X2 [Patiria miniata]|uniref:EGF-like domain-containing protein n=1 Tax=Patiria miniata TaxID=46514 RepID=A0A914B3I4_PATMI|nr:multiple epidermal growth factor-like domains protein 6 isoform X2 [Patiria miniata]
MSLFVIRTILWILLSRDVVLMVGGINIPPFSQINLQQATTESAEMAATTPASTPYGPMPFDLAGQERLTQLHNTERSAVDPPAADMNKVVWSTDLADAVASNLDSCIYRLADAQAVSRNRWLVEMGFYDDINDTLVSDTLTQWYAYGELYEYHQKSCTGTSESECSIYKLLTWSSMSALGCSQHYCETLTDYYTQETMNDTLYWKCLYDNIGHFTNPAVRPYTNGTVNDTCTQCESGSSWCENGLCNSGCDIQNANCSCALDPLCSGNGAFNETACDCNCTGYWVGNSCGQCGLTCQANSNLNRDLCQCDCLEGFLLNSTTTNCEDSRYSSFPSGSTTEPSATIGTITTDSAPVCGMDIICNGSGVLDPQTCECYCASGYKGSDCNEQCSLTDTECWSGYRKPPVLIDADFCPVYCLQCACDPSEGNCENNGTYSKVPGYELQYGMCRCYCPFPWSGLTCQECNASCYNGGTLDNSTCTCTCPAGFRPPNCLECKPDVSRWCTSRMAPYCDRVPVIRENCLVMCGICAL